MENIKHLSINCSVLLKGDDIMLDFILGIFIGATAGFFVRALVDTKKESDGDDRE